MKKIWRNWCFKVAEHNEPLIQDWSFAEEVWHPCDIFLPLIFGIVIVLMTVFFGLIVEKPIDIWLCGKMFLATFGISGFLMYMNWKAYS